MKRLLVSLCTLLSLGPAHADVTYLTRYFSPHQSIASTPETRVFLSKNAMLTQRWKYGYITLYQEDTVALPSQKKQLVINRTLGFSKVEPLADPQAIFKKRGEEVRVVEVGEERVLGFNTHHFRLERFLGGKKLSTYNEVWLAYAKDMELWPRTPPLVKPQDSAFVAYSKQAEAGLVVRRELWSKWDEKWEKSGTWEVSSLTHLLLEPSFYSVPKGTKTVSTREYTQALSRWNERLKKEKSDTSMRSTL